MVQIHDYRRSGHRAGLVHLLATTLAPERGGQRAPIAAELAGFLDSFDRSRDGFWTLLDAGVPAGCIALDGHDAGRATLRWWHVAPRLRGQGLGLVLLNNALTRAVQAGQESLELEPAVVPVPAQRLLERAGFRAEPTGLGRPRWRRWLPAAAAAA